MNHIHLGVTDLALSVDFYGKHFSFSSMEVHGEGVFLRNNTGFLLALDCVAGLLPLPDWFHLGFCVHSETEVISLYERLVSAGTQFAKHLVREAGLFASFYVYDPSGYKIEVSWHAEESEQRLPRT